ncbi:GntR family transcriptional regulator [Rhodococcus fascians]|nr:GntR family transcriptional regulator [Rhodococcus fascians]MBY4239015.1 GntR family transcriptional regulator [Rhodococcus fascians]MBY4254840.1 GntR family transcriptional regulator [Rhodococcus fascians]MBY4270382.1 GntR family transcriptional regulator [Rhodococcus fascians]
MAAPTGPGPLPPSLVEMATRQVRSEVLSGALEPGSRVVEETLCARLGISRAPVREALRLLAQQGLVEHLPRRGFRVTVWSAEDILELFELRQVLERHAIGRALPCTSPSLEVFAPVRAALDEMREADVRGDTLGKDDAHRRFHEAIVALAGSRQLNLAYAPILLKLQLPMARNLREEARVANPVDGIRRHEWLLEAIESNDVGVALAALKQHGELTYLHLESIS